MTLNTELANLAIGHLGSGTTIADLETEQSAEAKACRRFYVLALKQLLSEAPWPFATERASLQLLEEDPNDEWAFSYRYPSNCLQARRIVGITRNPARDEDVSYKIEQDSTGLIIYCDEQDAVLEYTKAITNYNLMPADFKLAFSFLLASYIAPSITAGDPFKLGAAAMGKYEAMMTKSIARTANEVQSDVAPASEAERSRE
jgi:hypothetical protein